MDFGGYQSAYERGPASLAIKVGFTIFGVVILFSVIGWAVGWFSDAASVTKEEFGPRAALEKYEWFKDAAAKLDAKYANIMTHDALLIDLKLQYVDVARREWPRDDRERYSQLSSEVSGMKMSFNHLAAEYNSAMAKFNWRFANRGTLPEGATVPLPREFKAYINQ